MTLDFLRFCYFVICYFVFFSHFFCSLMKKNRIVEVVVKVIVAALTAFLTALGTTSCMGRGPF